MTPTNEINKYRVEQSRMTTKVLKVGKEATDSPPAARNIKTATNAGEDRKKN